MKFNPESCVLAPEFKESAEIVAKVYSSDFMNYGKVYF